MLLIFHFLFDEHVLLELTVELKDLFSLILYQGKELLDFSIFFSGSVCILVCLLFQLLLSMVKLLILGSEFPHFSLHLSQCSFLRTSILCYSLSIILSSLSLFLGPDELILSLTHTRICIRESFSQVVVCITCSTK